MTIRFFLAGVLTSLVISWGIWLLIINWLDPEETVWLGFALFFLALFLAVASTAALIGYGLRRLLAPGQLSIYRLRPSLRQGIWLGLFFDLLLFLQLQRLLRWWITIIIIFIFLSIEFLFLSYEARSARYRSAPPTSGE